MILKKMLLISLAAVAASSVVQAADFPTVTPLQLPSLTYHYQESCLPIGWNADDTVSGICSTRKYGACSGRGCQPTRYTQNYITVWDINGVVQSAVLCDEVRTHIPQPAQYTYYNGFTECPVAVSNPNREVTYVPYGPYSWQYITYYFVGISDDGVYGLVDSAIVYPTTPGVPQS